MPEECAVELKATQSHTLMSAEPNVMIKSFVDPAKFSTLSRLIGVTTKVLEAVKRFKSAQRGNPPTDLVEDSHAQSSFG